MKYKTEFKSFSDVVNIVDMDKTIGLNYLVDCVKSYSDKKETINKIHKELIRESDALSSIQDTSKHICKHLNINVPISISCGHNIYIIDKDFNLTIVKSDVVVDNLT